MEGLSTPDGFTTEETEVKKSRFIAWVDKVENREQAMALLERARQAYPDARHHCWAYVIENGRSAAASDDGEPSGTAGKPILNVLQHKQVTDIMIVVIRYFGGIKLGAGGLVRAYSGAAQAVMDQVVLTEQKPICQLIFECDFSQEAQARYWVESQEGTVQAVDYSSVVTMTIELPEEHLKGWLDLAERHVTLLTNLDD